MHDAELAPVLRIGHVVRVLEALADLHQDVERVGHAHALALAAQRLDDRLEVRAVDVLHDDEVRGVGHSDVEDADDVRVLQVHRHARLVEEHRHELLVLREVRENALDRDGLLQAADGAFRHATVDLGHTTGVDSFRDLVSLVFGHPRAAERVNHNMGRRRIQSPLTG